MTHAPLIEQLETWARALDGVLLCVLSTDSEITIVRRVVTELRQVAADLARDESEAER